MSRKANLKKRVLLSRKKKSPRKKFGGAHVNLLTNSTLSRGEYSREQTVLYVEEKWKNEKKLIDEALKRNAEIKKMIEKQNKIEEQKTLLEKDKNVTLVMSSSGEIAYPVCNCTTLKKYDELFVEVPNSEKNYKESMFVGDTYRTFINLCNNRIDEMFICTDNHGSMSISDFNEKYINKGNKTEENKTAFLSKTISYAIPFISTLVTSLLLNR